MKLTASARLVDRPLHADTHDARNEVPRICTMTNTLTATAFSRPAASICGTEAIEVAPESSTMETIEGGTRILR